MSASYAENVHSAEEIVSSQSQGVRIAVDDILNISVFGEKELSGDFTVDDLGQISFPLIGDVYVQNLTLKRIENILIEKLSDGFLVNPSIIVRTERRSPFYILGEVRAPGSYDYVLRMNILNAVALAGGFTYRADRKKVKILRPHNSEVSSEYQEVPVHTGVRPGDIILIKERFF